nr:zinc finger (C2H2) and AT rich interactive domain containing protein [Hymenolepis microstoma]
MLSRHKNRIHLPVNISGGYLSDLNEEQFISELAKLRGIPVHLFNSHPRLNGRPISLLKLYNAVALRGGSKKVTSLSLWDEVADAISLQSDCINIGQAAKNVFQNYLETYERVQRSVDGQPGGDILEMDSNDHSLSLQLVENHLRHRWNLSVDLIESVEYRALLLALESGLPNELDYAINTVLLMSSQQNGFELSRCPQILPLMLSTVGIYSTGPCSYDLLKNAWRSQCNRDFHKFWHSVVPSEYGRQFLNPNVFSYKHLPKSLDDSPPKPDTCLTFRDTMTYHDVEGFRVQLVAMVLRNLVVTPSANAMNLSQEPDALRFACLCIYSTHTALRQLGLDILAYLHFPVIGPLGDILVNLIPALLASQDRVDVTRGLTILRHLCESPTQSHQGLPGSPHTYLIETSSRNLDFLTRSLVLPPQKREVIGLVLRLTCIRDLHILVLALDAVFALSTQGPAFCDALILAGESEYEDEEDSCLSNGPHHLIDSLVAFLTFEAQSFGSEGLIRIGVIQVPENTPTTVVNTTTTNTSPSGVSRRILEKPIAIAVQPPAQSSQQQPQQTKKDLQSASVASNLMLCPPPQPHAGCYAVPVPVTVVSAFPAPTKPVMIATSGSSLPISSWTVTSITTTATSTVVKTQEALLTPAISKNRTTTVTVPKTSLELAVSLNQPQIQQPSTPMVLTPVAPPPPVLPVVVAATPTKSVVVTAQPTVAPSPIVTNGKQTSVQQTTLSIERKTSTTSLRQNLQSPSSATNSTASSLINTLPKSYPDAPTDKREFATFWLNKNYEVHPQSSFPRVLIYAEYQKAHQVQFGTSSGAALSAGDFHAMIKTVFPSVDQVKVLVPNGNVEIHYNKLKHVDAPEPVDQALGVQHMLGTCLATQNSDGKGLKSPIGTPVPPSTAAAATPKANRKRSAVNLIETPSTIASSEAVVPPGAKQVRLFEEAIKTDGESGGGGILTNTPINPTGGVSSLINGTAAVTSTPQPIKLLTTATNPPTIVDNLIPVSSNGPIELATNGSIQIQQPVITASAIAFPIMDGKRMLNGFTTNTAQPTGTAPTLIDTSQGVLQFRTLLPTSQNPTQDPNRVTAPCRPSLVMQSAAAPGTVISNNSEIAAPQTLTCLGTFMASTSTASGCTPTPQQVFLYSLAPNAQLSIAPTPAAAIMPQQQQPQLISTVPQQQATTTQQSIRQTISTAFVCMWGGDCRRSFPSGDRLFAHIYSSHFGSLKAQQDLTCLWSGCKQSTIRRGSLSLLEHLRENHCNVSQVTSDEETSLTSLTTTKPSVNISRMAMIEREFRQTLQSDFLPCTAEKSKEGPVTKHIRLTTALILQNLVTYSSLARKRLIPFEPLLVDLALSGGEASNVLMKCLSAMATDASGAEGNSRNFR